MLSRWRCQSDGRAVLHARLWDPVCVPGGVQRSRRKCWGWWRTLGAELATCDHVQYILRVHRYNRCSQTCSEHIIENMASSLCKNCRPVSCETSRVAVAGVTRSANVPAYDHRHHSEGQFMTSLDCAMRLNDAAEVLNLEQNSM